MCVCLIMVCVFVLSPSPDPSPHGHVIACRITSENPDEVSVSCIKLYLDI